MAISDICFLTNALIDPIGFYFGFQLEKFGPMFCKILEFIPYYFAGFSVFILTQIAVDRMTTIVYPRRFLLFKKRWFQSLIVAIVACILVLVCILIPLNYNLVDISQPNSTQTKSICAIQSVILNIEIWIILVNFIIMNILINNWLNIKAIRFIMASRRRVNGMHNNRNSSLSSRDRKFTICSICLNLLCMVCKLPFFICILIVTYANLNYEEIDLIIKIASTITYIENGFSFFINMFVNSLFYEEFLKLFAIRKSSPIDTNNNYSNLSLKTISKTVLAKRQI